MNTLKPIFENYNWNSFFVTIAIMTLVIMVIWFLTRFYSKLGYYIKRNIGVSNYFLMILAVLFIVFNFFLLLAWYPLINEINTIYNSIIFLFFVSTITIVFSIIEYVIQLQSNNFFKAVEPYLIKLRESEEKKIFEVGEKYERDLSYFKDAIGKFTNIEISFMGFIKEDEHISFDNGKIIFKNLENDIEGFGSGSYIFKSNIEDFLFVIKDKYVSSPEGVAEWSEYYLLLNNKVIHICNGKKIKSPESTDKITFHSLISERINELESYYIPFELKKIDKINIPFHFFIVQNLSEIFATRRKIIEPIGMSGEYFHLALGIIRFIFLGLLIKILF